MKKILLFCVFAAVVFSMAQLYGSGTHRSRQLADVYVCEGGLHMAELQARVNVSRAELYIVSYCKCQAIDPGIRESIDIRRVSSRIDQNGKIIEENKEADCSPPKDQVYSCVCVGRSAY